jgi:peptide/nickel transport system permease protein
MTGMLVRRLAGTLPLLALITLIVFSLILLVPGDPAVLVAGDTASPEDIAAVRESLGLNDPLWEQYARWLGNAIQGDLGTSIYSSQSVTEAIIVALPVTLSLTVLALLTGVVIGLLAGTIAGMRPGTWVDRLVTTMTSAGVAIPHFWIAMVLLSVFSLQTDWLPFGGYVPLTESPWEWFRHLILPALALGASVAAEIARQSRASLTTALAQDYIRTAEAKGLSRVAIVGKHAMKNAALPVVTVLGLQFNRLFSSAVVVEQVFSLPGVGRLSLQSVFVRDFPMIQGVVLFAAVAVVLSSLLVDLSYSYFNPRVRQG